MVRRDKKNHFLIKSYFLFSGTFQFFFGNIDKTDKSPDFQYGWSNIKDKADIDHHFSFLRNVSDLVHWAMLIYTDERNAKQYITIEPKFQRLSYPLGRCLRYHHSFNEGVRVPDGKKNKKQFPPEL